MYFHVFRKPQISYNSCCSFIVDVTQKEVNIAFVGGEFQLYVLYMIC